MNRPDGALLSVDQRLTAARQMTTSGHSSKTASLQTESAIRLPRIG
jgi:hypothetical protein